MTPDIRFLLSSPIYPSCGVDLSRLALDLFLGIALVFMFSPAPGSIPSLGNTFGVLLLSAFISLMLYGLTLAQTIRYARLYPSDKKYLKILVAALFIADTLHSASMIHICYHYLVTDYLKPSARSDNVWTLDLLPLSTGVTVLLTQGFYTRRIYIVSYRYRSVVFVIVVLLLVEFGSMTGSTVVSFRNRAFNATQRYIWMDSVIFAVATVVDLILTGSFVTILRQGRTGYLGTDSALDMLARYALYATGLIGALTIPAFICSLALSHTFVYFAIAIPAAKVYSNSVLAVLNCRKRLPRPGNATGNSEHEHVELSALPPGRHPDGSGNPRRATVVQAQGTEFPHIVIDIGATSGEGLKGLGGRYADHGESKGRTRLDSAEIGSASCSAM